MLKIELNNKNLKILTDDYQLISDVDSYFTFNVKNAYYIKKAMKRKGKDWDWDGKFRFFKSWNNTLPAGLLKKLENHLKENDVEYEIIDLRKTPPLGKQTIPDVSFYIYQKDAIEEALSETRGIIQSSTGSGKTEIAIGILATLGTPKTLFLVPSLSLFYQTYERFAMRLGLDEEDIGLIGDGEWNVKDITVATVQTLSRAIKKGNKDISFLKDIDLVFADESHHTSSDSYTIILDKLINTYWRFALSATAFSGDKIRDYKLMGYFGDFIVDVVMEHKKPIIKMFDYGVDISDDLTYREEYDKYIVRNLKRNDLIKKSCEKLVSDGRYIMILVKTLEHGKLLKKLISNSVFVEGKDNKDVRKEKVEKFKSREKPVLIATTVFKEGVDIPEISAIIMAGAWKSQIANLQGIGRGMRKSEFNDLIVIDFMEYKKGGDRKQYISKHARKRLKIYKEKGYSVDIIKDVEEL